MSIDGQMWPGEFVDGSGQGCWFIKFQGANNHHVDWLYVHQKYSISIKTKEAWLVLLMLMNPLDTGASMSLVRDLVDSGNGSKRMCLSQQSHKGTEEKIYPGGSKMMNASEREIFFHAWTNSSWMPNNALPLDLLILLPKYLIIT
jgi:hypothetical protein